MSIIKDLVSVVIPCYNNAPFLRKCTESVLSQTYTNLEVIIIDDGSTDNPECELVGLNDKRLKEIEKISHSGVSTARNIGIERSSGEYLIFIDGDDWIEPNHIETLMKDREDYDSSMIMMSVDTPSEQSVSSETLKLFSENSHINASHFYKLYEAFLLSSPCNKLYRNEIIQTEYCRFDPNISYGEDLIFNLKYFTFVKNISLHSEITYHYVKHNLEHGSTRFHKYTVYTLERITEASKGLFKELKNSSLRILMRYYIWGIINLFHKSSDLTYSQRRASISMILSIPEFKIALQEIHNLGISYRFRMVLRSMNSQLISLSMKLMK